MHAIPLLWLYKDAVVYSYNSMSQQCENSEEVKKEKWKLPIFSHHFLKGCLNVVANKTV